MPVTIPWSDLPDFTQTITIGSTPYVFRAKWNVNHEYWTLDVLSQAGDLVIAGCKLVLNVEVFSRYRIPGLPPGFMIPLPVSSPVDRIDRENIGQTVRIYYFDRGELLP